MDGTASSASLRDATLTKNSRGSSTIERRDRVSSNFPDLHDSSEMDGERPIRARRKTNSSLGSPMRDYEVFNHFYRRLKLKIHDKSRRSRARKGSMRVKTSRWFLINIVPPCCASRRLDAPKRNEKRKEYRGEPSWKRRSLVRDDFVICACSSCRL
jgi:hypothetical protein